MTPLPGRPIAQAVSLPHSPYVKSYHLNWKLVRGTWSTAKFLPSYSVEHTSLNIFSWNLLTKAPVTSIIKVRTTL
jgi:hypothetical protein